MKLSQIQADVAQSNRVATMTVQQPNGKLYLAKNGEPCTLQFVGSESETYRVNREAAIRQNLVEQVTDEDPDKGAIRNKTVLAACAIVGWTGWEGDDDEELACTRENVLALFQADHICQQAWKNVFSHRDFFIDSSPA